MSSDNLSDRTRKTPGGTCAGFGEAKTSESYTDLKTLLGSIGKNTRHIKMLLKNQSSIANKVQSAMDKKARTKTPLNEGQQCIYNKFYGLYAQEGGKLQECLVRIEYIQNDLHTEKNQPFILALLLMQRHQYSAIDSLRRIIASGHEALSSL